MPRKKQPCSVCGTPRSVGSGSSDVIVCHECRRARLVCEDCGKATPRRSRKFCDECVDARRVKIMMLSRGRNALVVTTFHPNRWSGGKRDCAVFLDAARTRFGDLGSSTR